MKEKELEKNAPLDAAFKEREKLAGEQLKRALAKRRKEIPQIIAVLETQKALLDLRGNLAAYNLSLHDIVQNLSVYCPELGVKYMLAACSLANDYAIKKVSGRWEALKLRIAWLLRRCGCKGKVASYATERETLRAQYYRLAELSRNKDKDDVIHSFTEIVDNLQKIVPEVFPQLADALADYNDAALSFYRVTAENYKMLKLNKQKKEKK